MPNSIRFGFSCFLMLAALCCWTDRQSKAQRPQELQPSRFIRHSETSDTVVVFVHGISGDSTTTWTSQNGAYWPELMTKDKTFDGIDIYIYQYQTSILGRALSIDELAENLRLFLDTSGVASHKRIIFLTHSMGGLVTRAYILKYQRRIAERTAFIYFFSTPTTGSELASLTRLISRNPHLGQMQVMTSEGYLGNLQRQWLDADLSIPSYCAYERRATFGVQVVTQASASNLCTKRLDPIDADHITIVKPSTENDTSYLAFKSAFLEAVPKVVVKELAPPVQPVQAIEIHPTLKPAYDRFSSQLGKPRALAQLSDDAYQAEYDRAHIVWIKPLLTIYVLPFNQQQRKVIQQPDVWTRNPDLFDDNKLRRMFKTPQGKFPPHGGVANMWLKDPDNWKWLGWRSWYCRFFDEIFYQDFDGGIVFGPFHTLPTQTDSELLAVLNDGSWLKTKGAASPAPECRQIPDPFPNRSGRTSGPK